MNFKILLLLLIPIVFCQEYYHNKNVSSNYSPYQSTIELNIPAVYQFDDVMRHYRSDIRKREPQFLGFDIQDDNIEIDMEIAVPFLSVPTKKSLKRKHFANVNVAAMILAGIVASVGGILGGATRFIRGENFFNGKPWFRTGNKKKTKRDIHEINKIGHEDFMMTTLSNIDDALLQIDFDIYECAQRYVCCHVKNSLMNIEENRATNIDRVIVNIINSKWTTNMIADTIWSKAIEAGREGKSCTSSFNKCMPENMEMFVTKIQKYAKPKKK
ncbi:hypothetical protein PVAND_000025 [Polypedilum vanderplanki]|uniref:Uncharacterized protein n=1 Tax=Polypedilum vanderplanki TaxID=319348 RepID=A0A9J6BJ37_POLVA|nr:hypothetical protein PVAND_000025 [Polypedilum vanderplanki]